MTYSMKEIDKIHYITSNFEQDKEIKIYKSKLDNSYKFHMVISKGIGKIGSLRIQNNEQFSDKLRTLFYEKNMTKIVKYIELGFVLLVKNRGGDSFRVLVNGNEPIEEARFFCIIRNSEILSRQLNILNCLKGESK